MRHTGSVPRRPGRLPPGQTGGVSRTGTPNELDALVAASAAPDTVRTAIDRLAEAHAGLRDRLAGDTALAEAVVAVSAASRSLLVLLETDAGALDVLAGLDRPVTRPRGPELDEGRLRRWKQHEYLRIAARDLVGLDRLEETTTALAALGAGVLEASCELAGGPALAVIGMGKLGAGELNYASDIDVMFVADPGDELEAAERAAREVMRLAATCFRIDANLRPEGRDGRLVRSVESYEAYWERWAQPWEFQALLKARPVAGDERLGRAFAVASGRHLWNRSFDADDLRSLRAMKARTEAELERKGLAERDLKRAAGGIRDIEFSVQLLQLVHGRHDPALRAPATLDVLHELGDAGYVDAADADGLACAYRFLRTAEHRLQLVDGLQVHALPADASARSRIARVLGYRDAAEGDAREQLDAALRRTRSQVRTIHERLYFRPLLEAFAGAEGRLTPEAAAARLSAFGFADAERTRQAVAELTRGLTRSSRLMRQLLPLVLGWLADTPDPDLGLLGLRTLASGTQRSQELARAFRESPETARRLCTVLGTSRLLGEVLHHNPDLIADLGDSRALAPRSRSEAAERLRAKRDTRADLDTRRAVLKRGKERELLRIAARDLVDAAGVDATATDLTALAEATLEVAVETLAPPLPFAVVAMGRFAGGELSYGSDLDVIFVYDGDGGAEFEDAERLATSLLRFVGGTPASRIYEIDADLRPEGKQGPLARSLDGYRAYFERWAHVWERQAMIRARPVAGDVELGAAFLELAEPFVWSELSDAQVREIRRIKARVERERIPPGEDPEFHLKLGKGALVDVEFTVQLLQLQHGIQAPGTMAALARLAAAGVLDHHDLEVLADAYRYCERTRNRWFLIKGGRGDSLPQRADDLARLARSLGTTPADLREGYRRVTRRARSVVERLFYGQG